LIGIQPENFGEIYYWDGIEEEEYNPFWMSDTLFQFIEDCRVFTENPYKDLRP
jgi:hypothetical protein